MEYSTSASGPWTDCSGTETEVNVGTYYVRYKLTGDSYASATTTVYVWPNKPAGGDETVPYNGSAQTFLPTGFKAEWVDVTGTELTNPGDSGTATVTPKPGMYWSDGSNTGVAYTWTIVKATLAAKDFTVTGNSVVYDGGQHGSDAISATLNGFAETDRTTINALLLTDDGYVFGDDERRNVGEYSFSLKITENDHFFGTTIDITTTKFNITQKTPDAGDFTVSYYESTYDGTYDGDWHKATVTLNAEKYTVDQPDESTMSTWLTWKVGDADEQRNAGSYDVKVTVSGSKNFSNGTVTLSGGFVINKKTLTDGDFTISYDVANMVFDATAKSPAITLKNGYKTVDDDTCSWLTCKIGDESTQTDAGTYAIKVYVGENTNFVTNTDGYAVAEYTLSGKTTFVIQQRQLTSSDLVHTYSTTADTSHDHIYQYGKTHTEALSLADPYKTYYTNNSKDMTWLEWTVGDAGWTDDVHHSQTNAGTYQITAKVTNNTNFKTNTTGISVGEMVIAKATLTAADFTIAYKDDGQDSTTNSFVYDTKNKSATAALNNGDTLNGLTVKYFENEATTEEASPIKNVGTYKIKLYCDETTNYCSVDDITSDDWKITISQANLTLVTEGAVYKVEKAYNGSAGEVRFTVKALEDDSVTMKITFTPASTGSGSIAEVTGSSVDKVCFSKAFTNVTESGTWTWTASAGDNYNTLSSGDDTKIIVNISKAALVVSQETLSWGTTASAETYDADNHHVGVTVSAYKGNTVKITYTWTYTSGSTETNHVTGSDVADSDENKAILDLTVRDVKQSGKITWTASAGDNYETYESSNTTNNKDMTVNIAKANLEVKAGAVYKIDETYSGTGYSAGFTIKALSGDSVTMKIEFEMTSGSGTINNITENSVNEVSFSQTFMHVKDSGIWKWTASAGDNYNTLSSTDGTGTTSDTRVNVSIAKYVLTTEGESPNVIVTPYSEDYDGDAHAFEVTYTLVGQDVNNGNLIKVTYGTSDTSVDGDLDSIKEIYYTGNGETNPGKTAYYKLSYCDGVQYEDYELPAVGSSTITIGELDLTGKITLDGETIEDNAEGMTATIQYNGEPRTLSATDTNHIGSDETVATYRLKEADITEEALAEVLKNMGTYVVEVTVSAKSGEDYSDSYAPFVRTVTVYVEQAAVEIVDFSYNTVTEGEPMTMTVIMRSVGTLGSDIVITYRGQPLTTTCTIVDNNNGTYTATVVYDTSRGTIPSGTLQTISVEYPGDSNHIASAPTDQVIRMRSTGMPVIPEEGGQVPIDPDKNGIEVETPAGDIRFDLIDPPELGDGDTIIIDVTMRYATAEELVPDEESTIVLDTYGYVLHPNGDKTPIKYRVTPSVDVEVPSGKKPVVTLYDEYGSEVGTPDVLTYTSDSATFQTDADGSLSMRIGVTFKSKAVPTDEPVVPVYPEETGNTEEGQDYTLIIVVACVAITLEILAVIFSRRSRN